VTKTTTESDGFRSVRIEEYVIPANMASTVIESMDMTGEAPSSLYLTKIEDHRLPPDVQYTGGTLQYGSTAYPISNATGGGGGAATTTTGSSYQDERIRNRRRLCIVAAVFFVGFWVIFRIMSSISTTSKSYPSFNDDYWSSPSHPTSFNDDYWSKPSQPSWSHSWPSLNNFTMPPDLFKPFPPTKSPSPSSTPNPSWDRGSSIKFTMSPIFAKNTQSPRSQTYNNDEAEKINRLISMTTPDNDKPEGKQNIKVAPVIISPTFIRQPTSAPTPVATTQNTQKDNAKVQNDRVDEIRSIARD
jgi:hypothetical protein